jgi:molybdopterin molybdotransferase
MLDYAEAWDRVAQACAPLEAEVVPVVDALDRVLAADARSAVDLPPFDRSAMDGFAVRAADTSAPLRLAGEVAAGMAAPEPLAPGTAAVITTGAPLPPGADAVLQSELASLRDGSVIPAEPVAPRRHVRFRGEDVRAGDVLAAAGGRVRVQELSALASAGVGEVRVVRRPRVHVLATGDELLPVGAPSQPGRVHESNGPTLRALLSRRAGAVVEDGGVVGDDRAATVEAVGRGLAHADALLVCGGVSVGPHDHVRPALAACEVQERFWRVRLRPGKPLWFGVHGRTLVFGLPGNPLSVIVGFLAFVEPALRRLSGEPDAGMRTVPARLTAPAGPSDGRTTFLAARLAIAADGVLEATPLSEQGSHRTGGLAEADGFVIAPHGGEPLPAGARAAAVWLA